MLLRFLGSQLAAEGGSVSHARRTPARYRVPRAVDLQTSRAKSEFSRALKNQIQDNDIYTERTSQVGLAHSTPASRPQTSLEPGQLSENPSLPTCLQHYASLVERHNIRHAQQRRRTKLLAHGDRVVVRADRRRAEPNGVRQAESQHWQARPPGEAWVWPIF